jgi:Tfp pilus assembly protein PilF
MKTPCFVQKTFMALALASALSGCAKAPGAALRDSVKHTVEEQSPGKLLAIGQAYTDVGDSVRAVQYFSLAIDHGGDENAIFPRLMRACITGRQFRAATFYLENYLRRHPENAKLHFLAGSLYAGIGETKQARGEYERALRTEPKNPELHYALAVLSRDAEKNATAADIQFREYLSLDPQGPHAEEARGSLLESVQ